MDPRHLPDESILDPVKDEQLIKGLEGYARVAGIGGHPEYIWGSVKDSAWVTREDLVLMQDLPFKNRAATGTYYVGYALARMTKKFMALTGFLTRNYVDARYMTRTQLFSDLQEGLVIEGKVIFVPDWYINSKKGVKNSPMPQWKRDIVLSFLLEMEAEGRDLIMGIHDWGSAEEHYGLEIMTFIENNFIETE